jgi:Lysine methyltransferase
MCFFIVVTLRNKKYQAYSFTMTVCFKAKNSVNRGVIGSRVTSTIATQKCEGREEEREEERGLQEQQPAVARVVAESEVEPNFHKILATAQLLEWCAASLSKEAAGTGCSVLELSGGMGYTGIEFAKKFGCRVLVTDIDEGRPELARALVLSEAVPLNRMCPHLIFF